MESMRKEARKYLAKQRRTQRWQKVVTTLAGVVVFCTTYALILPAITMTTPLVCEKEEHTHTEACYAVETVTHTRQLVCEEPEAEPHTHDESCYTQETTYACGLEETEGHIHSGDCYTMMKGELTCTTEFDTVEREVTEEVARQVEHETTDEEGNPVTALETVTEEVTRTVTEEVPHIHTDDCYAWTEELTCALEETEGHTHTEACGAETVEVLSCGKEETEGHTHTDDCYLIPENEGETEEGKTLICEQEEHVHDDNCYLALELEEKVKYYCGFDAEHTHAEDCFFEDGALKCTISEHTHTEECLVEPLPEPEPVELCETFTAESEDGAVILTLHVSGTVLLPQAEAAEGEEIQESGFELVLTESKDLDAYDAYIELASEEGEVVAMGVLDYTLTYNGEPVDLSDCEVTAEVVPTEAFQQYMEDPQALGLMTLDVVDEDEASDEEMETLETLFTAYTERKGTVAYALTRGANPEFTVEYYAYLERVTTVDGTSDIKFPVINTEGGVLPQNGATPATTNLYLNEDNELITKTTLTQIYKTETFEYSAAPGLKYINIILTNQKSNYDLKEIWTWDGEGNDWVVHMYDPKLTRITNRPETAEADPNFILITTGSRLRMIYEPKREEERVESNFYDYDITDGKIYASEDDAKLQVNGREIGTQDNSETWAYVNKQGINSNDSVLGFGNGPGTLPTGMGDNVWMDANGVTNKPNQSNSNGFNGCTFGLVQSVLSGNHKIQYNISAPNLFNDGRQTNGKTLLADRELAFSRVGDTWTLSAVYKDGVNEPIVGNLETFKERWNWNKTKKIYGNDFWPLDDVQGHDLKHGDSALANVRKAAGATDPRSFPTTDFGGDHNAYFGMQFGVEFSLTKKYAGPLEYYFFGDDDMWVYLVDTETKESRLICDIGGVHASVGEYVNLWDYIDENDFLNADGTEKRGDPKLDANGNPKLDKDGNPMYEDYIKKYELHFYYTERGASGSTCWMQFTLPTVVGLDLEELLEQQVDKDTGSLWIQKELNGVENTQDFEFRLTLSGDAPDNYMVLGSNGELLEGENALEYIGSGDHFKLQAGDILVIKGLPEGTTYEVEEITTTGYHTEITTSVGTESKVESGVITSGTIKVNDTTKVVYTNISSYELPATGGSGTTLWYTMGTLLLAGAAYLMYKKRQWIMREGDAM